MATAARHGAGRAQHRIEMVAARHPGQRHRVHGDPAGAVARGRRPPPRTTPSAAATSPSARPSRTNRRTTSRAAHAQRAHGADLARPLVDAHEHRVHDRPPRPPRNRNDDRTTRAVSLAWMMEKEKRPASSKVSTRRRVPFWRGRQVTVRRPPRGRRGRASRPGRRRSERHLHVRGVARPVEERLRRRRGRRRTCCRTRARPSEDAADDGIERSSPRPAASGSRTRPRRPAPGAACAPWAAAT